MDLNLLIAKLVGPVLLVRSLSILIDKKHFEAMLEGLDKEIKTLSFSFIPVTLFAAALFILNYQTDRTSFDGIAITCIAVLAIIKTSLLMLFPDLMVEKAKKLGELGVVAFAMFGTLSIGICLTYLGYFA